MSWDRRPSPRSRVTSRATSPLVAISRPHGRAYLDSGLTFLESPRPLRRKPCTVRHTRAAGREREGREEAYRNGGPDVAAAWPLLHLQGLAKRPGQPGGGALGGFHQVIRGDPEEVPQFYGQGHIFRASCAAMVYVVANANGTTLRRSQ